MKKLLLTAVFPVFMMLCNSVKAQDFYALDSIRDVEIIFAESNWDFILDSMAGANGGATGVGPGRLLGTVIIDGMQFDSCGIRFKGNSSYEPTRDKNPINIKLDYVIDGQEYMGYSKIKLANGFADPTLIRETLMYELTNHYMDCPRANFARVTINGDYKGVYTNQQSVNGTFNSQWFGSSGNAFFKCDPVTFDIWGDNSNLAYHADSMAYDTLYDMKSDFGLADFQALTYELEFNPSTIDQYLDVDRVLWFHAVSNMFVHLDGYYGFAHNFYMYKADNNHWNIVLWDANMSFGGLPWNGSTVWPLNASQMEEHNPFLYEFDPDYRPLIAQLLQQPRYRNMYVAHCRTILDEFILNEEYFTRAQYHQSLIDAEAQTEPYPFYSYADFQSNMYSDQGTFFDLRLGLKSMMDARETYLLGLPEFQDVPPLQVSHAHTPTNPVSYSTVNITAEVTNATEVYVGYRYNKHDIFTRIEMFDDGLNGDGAAGDNVYGATIATTGTDVQYYIYAENATSGSFSPRRAEYEYYTIAVTQDLVINELAATNAAIQADQDGEFDDWIELYNNTASPIDLNGFYLSDNAGNPTKWAFPDTVIAPNDFLIIWADNDTLQSGLHANFKLGAAGESVLIYDSNISGIADEVVFPVQTTDITFGRYPNGTGNFAFMNPTFSSVNSLPVGFEEELEANTSAFFIYPNPTNKYVNVQFSDLVTTDLNMYDLLGKQVFSQSLKNTDSYIIDVSNFDSGIYIIQTSEGTYKKLIVE